MDEIKIPILPYSGIVGQERLKMALELAYIAPRIGGVLLTGQRGTGKSTIVRAFAQMMYGKLPVTLPINATEDRVVGGWQLDELVKGELKPQEGLLKQANNQMLYVDEVNLLDDHIVNIILDVTATGILVIQREGRNDNEELKFTLVGTMNPEEGELRPQLLDRFGLVVQVVTEDSHRSMILKQLLDFDRASLTGGNSPFIDNLKKLDEEKKKQLELDKKRFAELSLTESLLKLCVELATEFKLVGHRGDYTLALSAQAEAARQGATSITAEHLEKVAQFAIQHRRGSGLIWKTEDDENVRRILGL